MERLTPLLCLVRRNGYGGGSVMVVSTGILTILVEVDLGIGNCAELLWSNLEWRVVLCVFVITL